MNLYVMEILAVSNGRGEHIPVATRCWLKRWDVDAHDGRGDTTVTHLLDDAAHFESFTQAFETWRSVSKVRPRRADGKPNRPLTALTIQINPLRLEPTQ